MIFVKEPLQKFKNMAVDIVVSQGRFLRLSGESMTLFSLNSLRKILPGDVVEYEKEGNLTTVVRILDRERMITYGILYGKTLSLPLMSSQFLHYSKSSSYASAPLSCLVKLVDNEVNILKTYGPVCSRSRDLEICRDIYSQSAKKGVEPRLGNPVSSFYDREERADHRDLYTLNIDPPQSKDFDDAISVDVERRVVYVHIVDIHHLFLDYPHLETRSLALGNTLYLPEGNYNILPDECSEDLFSLVEGMDRRVITVEFVLDSKFDVERSEVYPSLIRVKRRYHYEEVDKLILEGGDSRIDFLSRLSENKASWPRSSLDIPQVCLKVSGCLLKEVERERRTPSHLIVETLMIKTNQVISERLRKTDYGINLERYHEKTGDLDLTKIPSEESELIALRSRLRRAKYSASESGHFALNLKSYTHFTSPLRRSFDVLVHRVLAGVRFDPSWIEEMVEYLNERGELTDRLCRFYQDLKILTYLERGGGVEYEAVVLKVKPDGMQFFIQDLHLKGYISLPAVIIPEEKSGIRVLFKGVDWKTLTPFWEWKR